MKVALVSPYGLDHPGGVQDQVIRLQRWLESAGHDAWVVAPGSGDGWRSAGDVMMLPANRSMAPIAIDPRAGRRALRAIAGAEVVHVHEPLMPAVSLAVALRASVPLVGTFHADPSRLIRGIYRVARGPLRRVSARLQVATAVSQVAAGAAGHFADVRVIPNAIDASAFVSSEERRHERVVFVGRDEPRKGLDVLLTAWRDVQRRHPRAELLVISETKRSPVSGVRFLGPVDEDEKRRLLATSLVLAAPNTGGESFGLVVAEGMAAGCAVVASGLPAFAAVLGETGRLVPPGEASSLGVAIGELLDTPAAAVALGTAAAARVERFDIDTVGAQYVQSYEDAMAAFSRTGHR